MTQAQVENKSGLEEGLLDPVSRASEILFGLIMVLSFTCSLSAVTVGNGEVHDALIGALGCNLAWGIIDAFFYLMNVAAQNGRERLLIQKLRDTSEQAEARELFKGVILESIVGSLTPNSFSEIRSHLLKNSIDSKTKLLTITDLRAAFIVFALVFLTTFPVAIPFLVMHQLLPAMRVSNAIALLLLFGVGASLGRYAGRRPWIWGMGMMTIGVVLVGITIALGG